MHGQDDDEPLQVDAEGGNKDFRALAIEIGDDLHDDDIEGLKFISRDFLPGAKLERMKNTQDLFSAWEKYGKFGKNLLYLAECLAKIGRLDLLEELGYEEEEIDNRIQQGGSEITDYRKMLFEIGEDLDSEELQKMLYLLGDLKKKDREKIKSVLGFFTYLEQKKTIDQNNLFKLEEMLRTIDRNDLVEIIINYKARTGQGRPEEGMDTTDYSYSHLPQGTRPDINQKNVQGTIAERPAAHAPTARIPSLRPQAGRIPPAGQPSAGVEREVALGVAYEDPSKGLRIERELTGSIASPFISELEPVSQNVIVDTMLKDISERVAREVDGSSWIVFGTQLKLTPDFLQKVSRQFPQINERMYFMLTYWLHSWVGGYDTAMSAIIDALHEVRIHHLAEQLSHIYRPQGLSETSNASVTQGTGNISVGTNEAQYDPQASEVPAGSSGGSEVSVVQTVGEPIAFASPAVELVEDKVLPSYKMDRKPRGLCLIINIEKFHKNPEDPRARDMPNREGSSVDATNLMNTFKELYFVVHLHENLVSSDMVRLMVQTALSVDHSNYDCFVCCILSHGTTGHVYGADGTLVNISDLTGPLKSVVCPSLAGKPKLFFIQACQGRQKQPGFEMEEDGVKLDTDGIPREVIPNEADFLMGYATVPGFVSYRSRTHGSWYITKLCDMLNKHGTKYDLLSVLLLVNNEIGRANAMMEGGRYKQSPAPLYTLRKKLIFS